MTETLIENKKNQALEALVALIQERWSGDQIGVVQRCARLYYMNVPPEDVLQRSMDELYGAAIAHWNFAEQRQAQESKIRVYNPSIDRHGWGSTHTIIEIACDDSPFLVDSLQMELNRLEAAIHLIIHPVLRITRSESGNIAHIESITAPSSQGKAEAWIHIEIDRHPDDAQLEEIQLAIANVLLSVRKVVGDFHALRERLQQIIHGFSETPPPYPAEEIQEVKAFMSWVYDNHFIFMGARDYVIDKQGDHNTLSAVPESGLGVLRDDQKSTVTYLATLTEKAVQGAQTSLLTLTKSDLRSEVHRSGYLDFISIKQYDKKGKCIGERRFIGLYTSAAYNLNPYDIPLLRRKLDHVLQRAKLHPTGHSGKALKNILETYPRDELFQVDENTLYDTAIGVLRLQERQRVKLFARTDTYQRFIACIVYVPRERYNTEIRVRMQEILTEEFGGSRTEFTVSLSENVLARIYFVVHLREAAQAAYPINEIESRLAKATRSWVDEFTAALVDSFGEAQGIRLARKYGAQAPAAYRETVTSLAAVGDAAILEDLSAESPLLLNLYKPLEAAENEIRLKIYAHNQPLHLSDVLPCLENLGVRVFDERQFEFETAEGVLWIHDFGLHHRVPQLSIDQIKTLFQDAFAAVWCKHAENDGFNRLVLSAQLTWREVALLRSYCKYLRQIGSAFSQPYMENTLSAYPNIARQLVKLFHARFDPKQHTETSEAPLNQAILTSLDQVTNLDQDRILRRFLACLTATVRTSYYQQNKPYLALKFDCAQIPNLPQPRPQYEIFVYSPRFEAVHLRGGKVARGGLRWSDRVEDFRTEILGLIKAQMVKNAVIVPIGAKGGFVLKQAPPREDREAFMAEGVACYQNFIRGLLDITDNLVEGNVVPPIDLVRHDQDDPYLVVAADKGTATFSDIANAISIEYNFWLGDAFASGGSAGYDHKKMGITARGGWECVKHHFRELGKDVQNEAFTVIGIGDMSGDVFGNGLLMSQHAKLIAAVDHRHIFLDPTPDPAISFAERDRLFRLPRSSWDDYDKQKISHGGGVFPRSAKRIALTPAMQQALNTDVSEATPDELIRIMLKAPVDLLWNGGIGTYVKSSAEDHTAVGDKSNDGVRVNGNELRCRVVGEGGNLGFTQRGRIEYALNGGKINTDFIDNSGGVDCSDHEVNIKILLNGVVADGDLTQKQRDKLLASMTDDVAQLVLTDNYEQTRALSLNELRAPSDIDLHRRMIRSMEKRGQLDRKLEFLPSDEELKARHANGQGLARPELAVLLAYGKMRIFDALIASDVPETSYFDNELRHYFPNAIQQQFEPAIKQHRLRREIIATAITNKMVNRVGASFVFAVHEATGADAPDIVRGYTIVRDVFKLNALWHAIDGLDGQISAQTQTNLKQTLGRFVERGVLWLLRNRRRPLDIASAVTDFETHADTLRQNMLSLLTEEKRARTDKQQQHWTAQRIPTEIAAFVASLDYQYALFDLADVARRSQIPLTDVAKIYFALGSRLGFPLLRDKLGNLITETHWQIAAKAALFDELYAYQRQLTAEILRTEPADQPYDLRIETWQESLAITFQRYHEFMEELTNSSHGELAVFTVILRELRNVLAASNALSGAQTT